MHSDETRMTKEVPNQKARPRLLTSEFVIPLAYFHESCRKGFLARYCHARDRAVGACYAQP